MSLQRRLVAVVALLLVVGLVVADVVTYASVRSFLYGQADNTLAQNEALGFNYLTFAAPARPARSPGRPVAPGLHRRLRQLLDRCGKVILRRPSGSPTHPDPAPILTKDIPVQQVPDIDSRRARRALRRHVPPRPRRRGAGQHRRPRRASTAPSPSRCPRGRWSPPLSLNPTNDTLASLRRVELLASLAVLLAMGLLVLVVVRRGLRPLRQMAGTADAIASGDLTRRVPEETPGHRGRAPGRRP